MNKTVVRYCKNGIIALFLAVLLLASGIFTYPVGVALADQANPDSAPSANIYIYRNILETGDFGVYIYGNIPYASTPNQSVSDAFIWQLINTDGTTEIGSTTGYSYNDSGYGFNVYWMYFSASDAPAWGGSYYIRLSGNPAVFDDPPIYNYPVVSSYYSSLTATSDVKTEIANRILIDAADLDLQWGLTTTTSLLLELETGTVLSVYGESVFRGAIYGCQAIAPDVFRFVVETITTTNRDFGNEYSANVSSQWSGTWVATAQEGGADFFGTSYDLLSIVIIAAICIGLLILQTKISSNFWSAMIDISVVLIVAARLSIGLGEDGMAFVCLIAALFWTYDSAKFTGLLSR